MKKLLALTALTLGMAVAQQGTGLPQPAPIPVNVTTLKASGAPEGTFLIKNDYLYKRDLNVRAFDLDAFLKANMPNINAYAVQGWTVILRCKDGYAPKAKLADLLGAGGLLAYADADLTAPARWNPAPYKDKILSENDIDIYMVWKHDTFPAKPAPWGLASIEFVRP